MQVHTLVNPSVDSFREAQKSLKPNILYFQGSQLENDEEIGTLVWGDLDVSKPDMFSALVDPPLPTTVSNIIIQTYIQFHLSVLHVCFELSIQVSENATSVSGEHCSKLTKSISSLV